MSSEITRPGRLAGKIAFITGTGGGQGSAAARLFAAEGARVVGCDLDAEKSEATAAIVREAGGEMVSFAPVDLSDPDAARDWIERGVAEFGGIDILYNNASLPKFGLVGEITPEDWSFTIRNELDLVLWTTQAAWPHLVKRGGGSIVNTASGAGQRGWYGVPEASHAAAKAGVIALTRQIAADGYDHGIRANSISPGFIATPNMRASVSKGRVSFIAPKFRGRFGRPEDIGYCALYLASDESGYVTASDFVVDGGALHILKVPDELVTVEGLDQTLGEQQEADR
ncbi:SDR family NAD(P)-dependent oxidoreductase [Rhodococcus sp. T2V]|uniref:SDR family NAD(P)-dependent oxidoreductase n=1 Tax=Rhodococcus sp. T2V TaxID=3034164 RepID=UPI0023E10898|nr:SDR family NAD(P)-dependent oxidoreductase [Rhodococcus sp. T2V]MDF3311168.1 SDR family NAD(P)-dependent oxidoreductase [Rhodococcus sp. T2V]